MGIKLLSFSLMLSFMSHWLQWVDGSLHISRSQLACAFISEGCLWLVLPPPSLGLEKLLDYLSGISEINDVANTQCCAVNAVASTQCCAFNAVASTQCCAFNAVASTQCCAFNAIANTQCCALNAGASAECCAFNIFLLIYRKRWVITPKWYKPCGSPLKSNKSSIYTIEIYYLYNRNLIFI